MVNVIGARLHAAGVSRDLFSKSFLIKPRKNRFYVQIARLLETQILAKCFPREIIIYAKNSESDMGFMFLERAQELDGEKARAKFKNL